jgi:hypothetical protein
LRTNLVLLTILLLLTARTVDTFHKRAHFFYLLLLFFLHAIFNRALIKSFRSLVSIILQTLQPAFLVIFAVIFAVEKGSKTFRILGAGLPFIVAFLVYASGRLWL